MLIQCGVYVSTFQFKQDVINISLKLNKSIPIKYSIFKNITKLKSTAHGFSKYTTLKVVTALHNAEFEKRQKKEFNISVTLLKLFQIIVPGKSKGFCKNRSAFAPLIFRGFEPSSSLLIDKLQN